MAHLSTGGTSVGLAPSGPDGGRFFVLGGEPFAERLVMWWNFVARTGEEIARTAPTGRRDGSASPVIRVRRWRRLSCQAFRCVPGNFFL